MKEAYITSIGEVEVRDIFIEGEEGIEIKGKDTLILVPGHSSDIEIETLEELIKE